MNEKKNPRIRRELRIHDTTIWQLADILGKSEPTVIRMLRHELPDEVQGEIISKIREAANDESGI